MNRPVTLEPTSTLRAPNATRNLRSAAVLFVPVPAAVSQECAGGGAKRGAGPRVWAIASAFLTALQQNRRLG
jgi:hypothetical protein